MKFLFFFKETKLTDVLKPRHGRCKAIGHAYRIQITLVIITLEKGGQLQRYYLTTLVPGAITFKMGISERFNSSLSC